MAKGSKPVRVVIGNPIPRDELDALRGQPKAMMDFLRAKTYALSPKPLGQADYGFEFERSPDRT